MYFVFQFFPLKPKRKIETTKNVSGTKTRGVKYIKKLKASNKTPGIRNFIFLFSKLRKTNAKPKTTKKSATRVSSLDLERTICHGLTAIKKADNNATFRLLKIERANKYEAKTVKLPSKAPGNLVENSLKPKYLIGIIVKYAYPVGL